MSFYRSDWQDRGALPIENTGGGGQPKPQQGKPSGGDSAKQRNLFLSLLPMATSILGGIGGSFVAPVAGTAAGGAAGGALGEWLAQKLNGEKDDLGKVGVEGAFGALGGVGKAVKGAKGAYDAVRAGEGAAGATQALRFGRPGASAAADTAATVAAGGGGGIKSWVGNKLLGAADDTALRASKMNGKKEALKGFDKRYGEDLGAYLRKNDLIGKTGKEVEANVIKPLGEKYGSLVSDIPRDITSSDLLAHNQKALQKLLYDSKSSTNKKLSADVLEEIDHIFKGGAIDPKTLNAIKGEYQTNARNAYKLGANAKPGVDEKVAEFLKKTLQGVSGSDELAKTGKGIDKAYKAADLLASAEQNGRGTLALGLTDLLAAGGGGVAGGVPGMVAGIATKRAINSPKVQSFIANKLASAGEKLTAKGAGKVASTPPSAGIPSGTPSAPLSLGSAMNTAKSMAIGQAPVRAAQGLAGLQSPDQNADPNAQDQLTPDQYHQIDEQNLQAALAEQNGGDGSDSQYSLEAMMSDIQRDPKNAKDYMSIHEYLNPQTKAKAPNATQIGQANNAQSALTDIQAMRDAIGKDGGVLFKSEIPGGAIARGLTGTTDFDAARRNVVDVISRLRSGAALTEQETKHYLDMLPKNGDSQASAAKKLDRLQTVLAKFASPEAAGTDLNDLMSAQ